MLDPGPETHPLYNYRLSGTVKDAQDQPLQRRVRAGDHMTGLRYLTWSDPTTGAWEIKGVSPAPHFVIVHEDTQEYQSMVFDYSNPVPIT